MEVIRELHDKFGGSKLFGNEKDDSFKSSIGQIYQTLGGADLYPSVEEGTSRHIWRLYVGERGWRLLYVRRRGYLIGQPLRCWMSGEFGKPLRSA